MQGVQHVPHSGPTGNRTARTMHGSSGTERRGRAGARAGFRGGGRGGANTAHIRTAKELAGAEQTVKGPALCVDSAHTLVELLQVAAHVPRHQNLRHLALAASAHALRLSSHEQALRPRLKVCTPLRYLGMFALIRSFANAPHREMLWGPNDDTYDTTDYYM